MAKSSPRKTVSSRDVLLNIAAWGPPVSRVSEEMVSPWEFVCWYRWRHGLPVQCLVCNGTIGRAPAATVSQGQISAHGRTHVSDETVEAFEALIRLVGKEEALVQMAAKP
jgi:hypothetical protein